MAFQPGAGSGGQPSEPRGNQDKDMKDLFDTFIRKEEGGSTIMDLPTPFIFTLRDVKQKVVRLQSNNLVAETSNSDPEKLSVVPNRFVQGKQYPIILGVQGGSSCLSCGTSAQPKLQLENKQIMELFEDKEQATRFTFHNIPEGSTHRFESAAYPGWFLCTSQKSSEPIHITNRMGETEITEFYFNRILT
ncbi:interleukin-36 receptor antagonist protein-like [Terrapene carolina triunguis]|uniref:interleukin-36 receptor antagonist protein-like n=1 Tax=Terrapene triunguis TaxID=2587831 RepID=UPI000CEF94A0|nr:interleukin-36 receptor antagonist protein-like [Terrapene carolina triunguis]XP_026512609.1 interleukin-36 receptor antagonist protein-like [Terrapene carolina triunguis]